MMKQTTRLYPRTGVQMLVLTALFAALTAVGAFLHFPLGATSVTLQFFFTALAGVLLGPKYGALSQLVYTALGLAGVPILLAGGGLGYIFQPSCGFLLALTPSAALIGLLSGQRPGPARIALASLAGLGVLYLIGLPYMALILNGYLGKGISLPALVVSGMLVYLPGDALKIAAVCLIAPTVTRRLAESTN